MGSKMEFLYSSSNFSSKEIAFMKSESDTIYHSDFTPDRFFSDFITHSDIISEGVIKSDITDEKDDLDEELDEDVDKELYQDVDKELLLQFNSFIKDTIHDDNKRPFTCIVLRLKFADSEIYSTNRNRVVNYKSPQHLEVNQTNLKEKQIDLDDDTGQAFCNDKNDMETIVHALEAAIPIADGTWQWLSESILISVIWRDVLHVEGVIIDIIKFISETLKIECYAGAAHFPFMDFQPCMVPFNAVKALDHAAFLAPNNFIFFNDVTQNIYGDRLYHLERIEDAARAYEKGLEIQEDNINLINSLGVCYSLMNHLELARRQFERAISVIDDRYKKINPLIDSSFESDLVTSLHKSNDDISYSQFMIYYNAALTCNLMGDIEKGVEYINNATAMHTDFFEVELTAGIIFLKANLNEKALLHLDKALSLKPESAIAHRMVAELYLQTNQPSKAVREYSLALKNNPCDANAMSGLARAFEIQNKNLDIALTLALHSTAILPNNPCFRTRLAKIYLKKGEFEFADIEFSKAEKHFKEAGFYLEKDASELQIPSLADLSQNEIEPNTKEQHNQAIDMIFDYDADKTESLTKKSA